MKILDIELFFFILDIKTKENCNKKAEESKMPDLDRELFNKRLRRFYNYWQVGFPFSFLIILSHFVNYVNQKEHERRKRKIRRNLCSKRRRQRKLLF